MPFTLSVNDAQTVACVAATGLVTATDLLQLHAELAAEATRREYCIIDFSGADVSQLTGPLVRDLAALPPRFKRLAIVATQGAAYGLARMYQASADYQRAIGIFMTAENAIPWLLKRTGTQQ
jgi:hypothetical protein